MKILMILSIGLISTGFALAEQKIAQCEGDDLVLSFYGENSTHPTHLIALEGETETKYQISSGYFSPFLEHNEGESLIFASFDQGRSGLRLIYQERTCCIEFKATFSKVTEPISIPYFEKEVECELTAN